MVRNVKGKTTEQESKKDDANLKAAYMVAQRISALLEGTASAAIMSLAQALTNTAVNAVDQVGEQTASLLRDGVGSIEQLGTKGMEMLEELKREIAQDARQEISEISLVATSRLEKISAHLDKQINELKATEQLLAESRPPQLGDTWTDVEGRTLVVQVALESAVGVQNDGKVNGRDFDTGDLDKSRSAQSSQQYGAADAG